MPAVTLQVALPDELTLRPEKVVEVTGRHKATSQIAWLREHGWHFELDADGTILIGSLYAHLRLLGLDPSQVDLPAIHPAFDMSKAR